MIARFGAVGLHTQKKRTRTEMIMTTSCIITSHITSVLKPTNKYVLNVSMKQANHRPTKKTHIISMT